MKGDQIPIIGTSGIWWKVMMHTASRKAELISLLHPCVAASNGKHYYSETPPGPDFYCDRCGEHATAGTPVRMHLRSWDKSNYGVVTGRIRIMKVPPRNR